MLLKHVETQSMFHITADWLYFEAGHGKGPCEGVGGVSKRGVEVTIKKKQVTVIDCAGDYFKWAHEDISSNINYFLVSGSDVRKAKSQMDRWQQY